MNKDISLSIPTPCAQQWNTFTHTSHGGFCSTCNKTVIDFTKMGDAEIIDFFQTNPSHTCGRFRKDQLKRYPYHTMVKVSPGLPLLKTGMASLLVFLMAKPTSAQPVAAKAETEITQLPYHNPGRFETTNEHIIKGVVTDEYNERLPGINIVLKGTTIGCVTNFNGEFEFPQKLKEGDVLIFSFIGLETKEYRVPREAEATIAITLKMDMCVLMGEVAVEGVYEEPPSGFRKLVASVKGLF